MFTEMRPGSGPCVLTRSSNRIGSPSAHEIYQAARGSSTLAHLSDIQTPSGDHMGRFRASALLRSVLLPSLVIWLAGCYKWVPVEAPGPALQEASENESPGRVGGFILPRAP